METEMELKHPEIKHQGTPGQLNMFLLRQEHESN